MRKPLPILLSCFVLFISGCRDSVSQTGTDVAGQSDPTWSSEVNVTEPRIETGTTHDVRANGRCNLHRHGTESPFEFNMRGNLTYRVRLSAIPRGNEECWVSPLIDVTNGTGSVMYVRCYAAFFNEDGRLVGACQQGTDVESNQRPLQIGSMVVQGSQEYLLTGTSFQIVIYESDKQIGVEPISEEKASAMIGRSGKVISHLEQIDTSVVENDESSDLRLLASVQLKEPDTTTRNTHVRIQGAAKYSVYLSTSRARRQIQTYDGDGNSKGVEEFDSWRTNFELDRMKRAKGISHTAHAALLDESGQLIACGGSGASGWLDAPEDRLLSARQLEVVIHEHRSQTATN